jgi:hypothetical protein
MRNSNQAGTYSTGKISGAIQLMKKIDFYISKLENFTFYITRCNEIKLLH